MSHIECEKASEWELKQIITVVKYLYGIDISFLLKSREVCVSRSPATGRLRHVYLDGVLVMSLRSCDGFLVFTPAGWKTLREASLRLREVVVSADVARFVAEGKSLFSKHVEAADPEILPGDEVCVVSDDRIVAVGKAILPGKDMGIIRRGRAVKIRRGVS
uniref:Pseudouridine synthase n=1 Tax=Thermofilum pendens TaxID=2269 RepID=A0A7J3X6J2_THEPE